MTKRTEPRDRTRSRAAGRPRPYRRLPPGVSGQQTQDGAGHVPPVPAVPVESLEHLLITHRASHRGTRRPVYTRSKGPRDCNHLAAGTSKAGPKRVWASSFPFIPAGHATDRLICSVHESGERSAEAYVTTAPRPASRSAIATECVTGKARLRADLSATRPRRPVIRCVIMYRSLVSILGRFVSLVAQSVSGGDRLGAARSTWVSRRYGVAGSPVTVRSSVLFGQSDGGLQAARSDCCGARRRPPSETRRGGVKGMTRQGDSADGLLRRRIAGADR
jgi:hypothetical protein